MAHDLLVTNGTLVTFDGGGRVVEGGALWIREGVIEEVGRAAQIAPRHRDEPTLDARGGVVLPGLVNAHAHLYAAFARGIALPGPPPRNFAEVLERLWWRLDRTLTEEDVYYSALVGAIDSAKQGTTTIVDHHASPAACPGSLSLVRKALDEVGLRGVLAYEVSDRDGKGEEGIEENVRFIEACRARSDARFAGLIGLHASFTVGDATLAAARAAGDALGVGFHVHVAEDPVDSERTRARHGVGAVARLAEAGILREGTIAAHCIHLEDGDRAILARSGATVAHCPQSNTNNAVGTADLLGLLRDGIPVCLGTDGFTMSVLHEMQVGSIVHRLARRDPSAAWGEMLGLATRANPAVAARCLPGRFGALAPGHHGDLAVFRYDPPTPLRAETTLAHLLFGLSRAPVSATVVAGRVIQRDGEISGIDEPGLLARARDHAESFWKRFANG
jgi:putative selenium metabolism protein SsnA